MSKKLTSSQFSGLAAGFSKYWSDRDKPRLLFRMNRGPGNPKASSASREPGRHSGMERSDHQGKSS
ncbi:MAG: hypothetical protein LBW85_07360 [Deltaproteobacteria bacterium]|nr:hypothetical protein [Deltaproteobacteria bacterium]